jgi:hypothetical protein
MAMDDVIFLMIAIGFVLVAFVSTSSTLGASRAVRRIANWVTYVSCGAATISVLLAVWFLYWPPV